MISLLLQTASPIPPPPEASNVALWIAFFTFLGILVTAYFAYKGNKDLIEQRAEVNRLTILQAATQMSLDIAKQEIDLDSYALSFSTLESWNKISSELNDLFAETRAHRFLLFRAWNGLEAPRYTTAIIQYRKGQLEHSNYVHFELDEDYVQKILNMRRRKIWRVNTAQEGDTAIGGVYRSENPPVTHAVWYHLNDEQVDARRVIVTYCSFGTDTESPFTEKEEIKQRLLVNLIKEKFDGQMFKAKRNG